MIADYRIYEIGEVCKKTRNIKWQDQSLSTRKYVDLSAVSRDSFSIINYAKINAKNAPSRAKKIIYENDIIFATTRPTLKRVAIISSPFHDQVCSTGFCVLRPDTQLILPRYLFYFLQTINFIGQMQKLQRGTSYPAVTDKQVKDQKIPLPPLPKQQRIVKILDEAFAAIDKAIENTEKNIQNCQELYDSYLNNVFQNPSCNWDIAPLGSICNVLRGGSPRPIKKYLTKEPNGLNWIKIGDTKVGEKYIYKTKEMIRPEGLKKSRLVIPGDFLLSNSMSFGRPYIMKTTGCIHDGWLVLKNISSSLLPDFLYYILGSRYIFNELDKIAQGSTVRNLNTKIVSKVNIPIPTIREQKEVIKKAEHLSINIKSLKTGYLEKRSMLEELKQSLLQKAFNGEL